MDCFSGLKRGDGIKSGKEPAQTVTWRRCLCSHSFRIMFTGIAHPAAPPTTVDVLKNWNMVVLTLPFVALYAAALLGLPQASDRRQNGAKP